MTIGDPYKRNQMHYTYKEKNILQIELYSLNSKTALVI